MTILVRRDTDVCGSENCRCCGSVSSEECLTARNRGRIGAVHPLVVPFLDSTPPADRFRGTEGRRGRSFQAEIEFRHACRVRAVLNSLPPHNNTHLSDPVSGRDRSKNSARNWGTVFHLSGLRLSRPFGHSQTAPGVIGFRIGHVHQILRASVTSPQRSPFKKTKAVR